MNRTSALLATGVLAWATATGPAGAQTAPAAAAVDTALEQRLQRMARDSAQAAVEPGAAAPRIEVELGQFDPRLTLAPCQQIEPYLPPGAQLVGRTRVGLRCVQGATKWNVFLPVTVRVFGRSLVASTALPAGTVLRAQHLAEAEVDLAASRDPAINVHEALLGRTLSRPLAAGDALRRGDLKVRQWFAAGDVVQVVAQGAGFAISAEGQAMGPGIEGQIARVRTESGRIVTGLPAGDRRIEVRL